LAAGQAGVVVAVVGGSGALTPGDLSTAEDYSALGWLSKNALLVMIK
jgi:hypothetical protein